MSEYSQKIIALAVRSDGALKLLAQSLAGKGLILRQVCVPSAVFDDILDGRECLPGRNGPFFKVKTEGDIYVRPNSLGYDEYTLFIDVAEGDDNQPSIRPGREL